MTDILWWLDAAAGEARYLAPEPYDDRPTLAELEAEEQALAVDDDAFRHTRQTCPTCQEATT